MNSLACLYKLERKTEDLDQNQIKIQRRRVQKLFWLFAAAAVCALLFEEQAAVLYVLSTLATGGLLIVVALSNLGPRDAKMQATAI